MAEGGLVECSRTKIFEFLEKNHELKGLWINGGVRHSDFVSCCKALAWFDFPKKADGFDLQAGTVRRALYDRFDLHVPPGLLRISAAFLGVPFMVGGNRFEFLFPMPLNKSALVYLDEFFIRESKVGTIWKG